MGKYAEFSEPIRVPYGGYVDGEKLRCAKYRVTASQFGIDVAQTISYTERYFLLPHTSGLPTNEQYFPLEARIVFKDHDFGNATYLIIEDQCGQQLVHKNITALRNPLEGYMIKMHIESDTELRHVLMRAFQRYYRGSLPFKSQEMSLATFVLINRFKGFPRNFYDAIPFDLSCYDRIVDLRFFETTDTFTHYAHMPKLYRGLGLPQDKQIRNTILRKPALLFYAKQIMSLSFSEALLLRFLSLSEIFQLLAWTVEFPGIVRTLNEMIIEHGVVEAYEWLEANTYDLPQQISTYILLSKEQQQRWVRNSQPLKAHALYREVSFSVPAMLKHEVGHQDFDCHIDGYDFVRLRTTKDFQEASSILRKSGRLDSFSQAIVIKKKSALVAIVMMEFKDNGVYEASLAHDIPVEENEEIYAAFCKWLEKYSLEYYVV